MTVVRVVFARQDEGAKYEHVNIILELERWCNVEDCSVYYTFHHKY